jgi:hypothetical protein
MKDDFEGGKIIPHALREKFDLPVAREACWHSPRGSSGPHIGRLPRQLELNYRTKTERLQDFFRHFLGALKRKCGRG